MIWPFRRRKSEAPEDRRDTEEWHIGDLGRCVDDRWSPKEVGDPKIGDLVRVTDVSDDVATGPWGTYRAIWLRIEGRRGNFQSRGFVKIRPLYEPATESVADMIRRHSKTPQPQGA